MTEEEKLIQLYSAEKLKKLSSEIINAYKNGNVSYLQEAAVHFNLDESFSHHKTGRFFKQLILKCHPDRISHFHTQIKKYAREKDQEGLKSMRRRILFSSAVNVVRSHSGETTQRNEQYAYEFTESDDFWDQQEIKTESDEQYGFIEAVKNLMYGNLDIDFLPKDLFYLNGILDLSGEHLDDLDGIEYCHNISGLNLEATGITKLSGIDQLPELASLYLSNNSLEELYCLENHPGLRVLDLSFNELSDIEILLSLPSLEYVNLIGNNLESNETVNQLRKKCIVII